MNTEIPNETSNQQVGAGVTASPEDTVTGLYLYCIIHEPSKDIEWDIQGMNSMQVRSIHHRDLAVVVSATPMTRCRLSRENTITHEVVIEKVMSRGYSVLPIRFGTISKSEEKIRKKLLEGRYWEFEGLIRKMEGKQEVGIRIFCEEKYLFDQVLKDNPKIVKFRDELAKKPPNETHQERIKIGQMVEEAVKVEKKKYQEIILKHLATCSVEHRVNQALGDRMVFNGAFLIESVAEADFNKRIEELNNKLGEAFQFKYIDVTPPFNFVNIVVQLSEEEG